MRRPEITKQQIKEAARRSYDERWLPASKAKSIKEMRDIIKGSECALCEERGLLCYNCPANDDSEYTCCKEWHNFIFRKTLKAKRWAAESLCKRLKNYFEG